MPDASPLSRASGDSIPFEDAKDQTGRYLHQIARKLTLLNDRQLACGLPPLQLADMTWEERTLELQARVNLLAADGPSFDLLASTGAHVLAAMMMLDRAEALDPASGEAA